MGKRGRIAKNRLPVADAAPTVDKDRERKYRAEDALKTLQRADECRQDKELMGDVKKLAKQQMETAKKFAK